MIDIETSLREGLDAFAAEMLTHITPPAVASISLRARMPEGREPPARSLRWPKVAAAVVVGAAVGTGVASAVGVLPSSVESTLHEFRSWGFHANGGASRVAAVTQGDFTYEVWLAPLGGGGQCAYDRVVALDGHVYQGEASSCVTASFPATSFKFLFYHYPKHVGEATIAAGFVPPAASSIEFVLADGTTKTVAGQKNGWFVATLPGVQNGSQIVAIRALAADGRELSALR